MRNFILRVILAFCLALSCLPLTAGPASAVPAYNQYSAISFGMNPTDAVDIGAKLAAACTSIGTGILYFPVGTYRLATNETIPSTIRLAFEPGAKIHITSGHLLTINSALEGIGPRQIFSFDGTSPVVFTTGTNTGVIPQWFGAVEDGSTDDTNACQAAISSLPNGGVVRVLSGTYKLTANLTESASNLQIIGAGNTTFKGFGLTNTGTPDKLLFEGFTVDLNGASGGHGVDLTGITNSTLNRVFVKNAGVQSSGYTGSDGAGGFGFLLYNSTNVSYRGCQATSIAGGGNNTGDGFYCQNSTHVTYDACVSDIVGRHAFTCAGAFGSTAPTYVRYRGCKASNTALSGIDFETGDQVTVDGCRFTNVGTNTTYYNPQTVYGAGYRLCAGIALTGGDVDFDIHGCEWDSGYYGITMGNGATNIRFNNNLLKGLTSDAIGQGGLAGGATKVKIDGNFIYGAFGGYYAAADWDITNNYVYGSGSGEGANFNQCTRMRLTGNTWQNFVTGCTIRQQVDLCTFEDNRVLGCGTALKLNTTTSIASPVTVRRNYFSTEYATDVGSFTSYAILAQEQTGGRLYGLADQNTIAGFSSLWSGTPAGVLTLLNSSKNTSTQVFTATDLIPAAFGGTGAATAAANVVFAGPTSGASAAPTLRALVTADLPTGIPDSNLATISTTSKVSNSATTATNSNTASAIVARDGSGNFSAGAITSTGHTVTGGTMVMNNGTSNLLTMSGGNAAPSFTTASVGEKLALYSLIDGTHTDVAIGSTSVSAWIGIPQATSSYELDLYGGTTKAGYWRGDGLFDTTGVIRATGQVSPSSGAGTELGYASGGDNGYILAYNRSSSAYKQLQLNGLSFTLTPSGTTEMTVAAAGTTLVHGLTAGGLVDTVGSVRATSATNPGSGSGTEVIYSTGSVLGAIQAYNRSGSAYLNMSVRGLAVDLSPSGTAVLTATTNTLTANASNLVFDTAGKGIQLKSGSNARIGTSTLVGGTVTVSNTSVGANTIILYSVKTDGGTVGNLSYTISNGTSFTFTSTNVLDTSTVVWMLVEAN